MIIEINQTVALEFYNNALNHSPGNYVSFVRGKEIDYGLAKIDKLLRLTPPEECNIQRRKHLINLSSYDEWEPILQDQH